MNIFSCFKTTDNDPLCNILTISGIRLENSSKAAQRISSISALIMFLSAFYALCCSIKTVTTLIYFFYYVHPIFTTLTYLLWFDLFRKRNRISLLIAKMKEFHKMLNNSNDSSVLIMNVTSLLVIFGVILTGVCHIYSVKSVDNNYYPYTFYVTIKNSVFKEVLLVFGAVTNFVNIFYITCISLVAFSALEYRCGDLLASYNNHFKQLLQRRSKKDAFRLTKVFPEIYGICQELRDILSLPLFLLMASTFLELFFFLMLNALHWVDASVIVEIVAFSTSAFIALASQGYLGSTIPEELQAIRLTAGDLVEKYRDNSLGDDGILFHLERIEGKKIIYLTACDLFDFSRSFTLVAIGEILTYGLLLVGVIV